MIDDRMDKFKAIKVDSVLMTRQDGTTYTIEIPDVDDSYYERKMKKEARRRWGELARLNEGVIRSIMISFNMQYKADLFRRSLAGNSYKKAYSVLQAAWLDIPDLEGEQHDGWNVMTELAMSESFEIVT